LINYSPSSKLEENFFANDKENTEYQFYYSDTTNHKYLRKLRQEYQLAILSDNFNSELSKIKAILNWTNHQWEHSGSNNPSKSDALTILTEAKEGNKFRCVEYGIVVSAALNSIGIPTRVLSLKTQDVEKVKRGAGHVVAEVYSQDFKKWVYIDAQFNVIPMLNEIPLNAVEFQNAILYDKESLKFINLEGDLSKDISKSYINWIGKYLFYFDLLFDQRLNQDIKYKTINGKTKLMLVPIGAKEPMVFQRKYKINYCLYTNSINDFYQIPK
jgi:hypothetical protein